MLASVNDRAQREAISKRALWFASPRNNFDLAFKNGQYAAKHKYPNTITFGKAHCTDENGNSYRVASEAEVAVTDLVLDLDQVLMYCKLRRRTAEHGDPIIPLAGTIVDMTRPFFVPAQRKELYYMHQRSQFACVRSYFEPRRQTGFVVLV